MSGTVPAGQRDWLAFEGVFVRNANLLNDACDGIADAESMEMIVEPGHGVLDGDVEIPEEVRRWNFDAASDERADVAKHYGEDEGIALQVHVAPSAMKRCISSARAIGQSLERHGYPPPPLRKTIDCQRFTWCS